MVAGGGVGVGDGGGDMGDGAGAGESGGDVMTDGGGDTGCVAQRPDLALLAFCSAVTNWFTYLTSGGYV